MKRLYLLRHAKAVPPDDEAQDHDRVLADRGRRDAAAMGHYLAHRGMVPALLLASTAARTRQTAERVRDAMRPAPVFVWRDRLYLATAGDILALVQTLPAHLESVMVVGHNPGLGALAVILSRTPEECPERSWRAALAEKFPTAALAVLDFPVDQWRDLRPGEGTLCAFVRPKDV